jgi:hypothetical protein
VSGADLLNLAQNGDLNNDGVCDDRDIDEMALAVITGSNDPRFDLNGDGAIDIADHRYIIRDLKRTWLGDSNLDGEFNSNDFVVIFQKGQYEDDLMRNSGWADGDWNGDQEFNTQDFVAAFQNGGYERGPLPASANYSSIPEPDGALMAVIACLSMIRLRPTRGSDRESTPVAAY